MVRYKCRYYRNYRKLINKVCECFDNNEFCGKALWYFIAISYGSIYEVGFVGMIPFDRD